jgi:hypothetical protein
MILILIVERMKSQDLLSRKRGIWEIPHEEAEAEPAFLLFMREANPHLASIPG